MAASDQHFRNQKLLDIVFGVTCILMLLSIMGMLVQDFFREFKVEQRVFRDVEFAVAERAMLDALPHAELQALVEADKNLAMAKKSRDESAVETAQKEHEQARAALDKKLDAYTELSEKVKEATDNVKKTKKEHESKIHVLRVQKAKVDTSYQDIKARLDSIESLYYIAVDSKGPNDSSSLELKEKVDGLRKQLDAAKVEQEQTVAQLKAAESEVAIAERELVRAESALKEKRKEVDRFAALAQQKQWTIWDEVRAMPVIDGFASPYQIKQYTLDNLPIDYSFKHVTRYDRCTTCHLGMERANYDPKSLAELRDPRDNRRLNEELDKFRAVLQERKSKNQDLGGFDLAKLPTHVIGISDTELTDERVGAFAAHPRLDLFVDANSPHSAEKFGCTICHSGQGSATDFKQATHTPDNPEQKEEWVKKFGWFDNHFWDFRMSPQRFTESGCLKCHHQVTDLIRYGNKEEAPKLLKGYNLVRENGCFGCHEIAGVKGGRWIGPDMRLEDGIPLEEKSAFDRARATSDPANPPGTMRKVGPSLYRLGEKTNAVWLAKWLRSPRGFRPDTRMPHFYGLSTNNEHYLAEEDATRADPKRLQADFPNAEIHSIAHYLLTESKGYLQGDDIYTRGLKARKQQLEALQKKLRDEGLDLDRGEKEEIEKKIDPELAKQIAPPTLELRDRHPPLAVGPIVDGTGAPVSVPAAAQDDKESGRRLFIERGCLGCHVNDATAKAGQGSPTVSGHATFGPNLSELAYKLGTSAEDKASARLWLIQWVLNPNVHFPRTRMPVTHLTGKEAADVAAWLLDQGKEWAAGEGKPFVDSSVPAPSLDTLKRLTRQLLRRSRSQQEVDDLLNPKDDEAKQRAQAWLTSPGLRADSDEAMLRNGTDENNLKLYIGRKAIGRMGCFGCHNIPGFETMKPIGTPLNDWGLKDAERLAFEDGPAFVHKTFNIVPTRVTREGLEKMQADLFTLQQQAKEGPTTAEQKREVQRLRDEIERLSAGNTRRTSVDPSTGARIQRPVEHTEGQGLWAVEDGKEPYEAFFADRLEHHHRDGFLHLKLADPRSYDYLRDREWDDRLRMPQFKFAPVRRHKGETEEAYQTRLTHDEAEAREAVMTFILGLVAEPIPLKYVHTPPTDRAAAAKGRQVLDKFNCGGCHLIKPGIFDLNLSKELVKNLLATHADMEGREATKDDHVFPNHNAWTGLAPFWPGRLTAFGLEVPGEPGSSEINIRLQQALSFPPDKDEKDSKKFLELRSYTTVTVKPDDILTRSMAYGGVFADLLASPRPNPEDAADPLKPYLVAKDSTRYKDENAARVALPPMLWRQGERTQPDWLFRFLKNPREVRPLTVLRMPKFNLSDDDARALVDYFAGSDRHNNPGIGLVYPYSAVPQTSEQYLRDQTKAYVGAWDDKRVIARAGELLAFADQKLQTAEAALKSAQDAESKAEPAAKSAATAARQKAEAARDAAKAEVDAVKDSAGKMNDASELKKLRARWEQSDVYVQDAYKILANKNSICLTCHQLGSIAPKEHQGPPLELAWERLRPEWTREWIASPQRLIYYNTPMPQNFPKTKREFLDWFNTKADDPHLTLMQVTAVRDVLMNLPRVADTPAARKFRETQGGVK